MLRLSPESSEPASRATPCSAISDDNEVFVYGGQPLATARRGALGQARSERTLHALLASRPSWSRWLRPLKQALPAWWPLLSSL